ncbi:MAG: glycoside hydrolase family 3 N-terminal domain-containing protein [Planctomycetota bacterium]
MTLDEIVHELTFDAPANPQRGIQQMLHGEALHGAVWIEEWAGNEPEMRQAKTTVFPQAIGLGCTWDPDLLERIGAVTARECRALNRTHLYSPNFDLALDPRFGRVEECYSEDPYLVARLGVGYVYGMQGRPETWGPEGEVASDRVLATAKHFAGYAAVRGGLNGAEVDISERSMRELHLPPFEAAVREAKIASVMPSHHDHAGVPCHANQWLLQTVLRHEWGFDGFVVSDNIDVHRLFSMHRFAPNAMAAARLGLEAGVDLELAAGNAEITGTYRRYLAKLVESGELDRKFVEAACRRVLTAKGRVGLLGTENLSSKPSLEIVGCTEHLNLAKEAALRVPVLLKNVQETLPLKTAGPAATRNRIAVIGPHAERVYYGGYSSRLRVDSPSLADVLRSRLGDEFVTSASGCPVFEYETKDLEHAVAVAAEADTVLLCVGDSPQTCAEGYDRASLDLPGLQGQLVDRVLELGKPVVALVFGGRPLALPKLYQHAEAVMACWYLGSRSSDALADLLLGLTSPSGKLSVSIPRSVGHLPCHYLRKPSFTGMGRGRYVDGDNDPLYPFGFGLSYSPIKYSDLVVTPESIGPSGEVDVTVIVENVGKLPVDEIVQVYVRDEFSSISPRCLILKEFQRVHLRPGAPQEVRFKLGPDHLAILDQNFKRVVEPGAFAVFVGGDSINTLKVKLEVTRSSLHISELTIDNQLADHFESMDAEIKSD